MLTCVDRSEVVIAGSPSKQGNSDIVLCNSNGHGELAYKIYKI